MFKDIESGTVICKYCGLTQNEIDGNFTIICNCRNSHTFIHKHCISKYIKNNTFCHKCKTTYKIDVYTKLKIKLSNIFSFFD